ncbi:hypothetical protein AB0D49_25525 [Streptomyces sp. NPDC048290]|uniref:hypothetical protein n=1 Tax=Streptomyces sp. NPDC048290 TaxID=3155811 RepID=UPI00342CFA91
MSNSTIWACPDDLLVESPHHAGLPGTPLRGPHARCGGGHEGPERDPDVAETGTAGMNQCPRVDGHGTGRPADAAEIG